ncbi:hypothetical protein [Streptomyces sp. NPDC050388]|uniref:hypothetical protein n=1 Tax=Streptomyces sp. NPDC050388 TaxID=3155781 RepID=UPI00343ABC32
MFMPFHRACGGRAVPLTHPALDPASRCRGPRCARTDGGGDAVSGSPVHRRAVRPSGSFPGRGRRTSVTCRNRRRAGPGRACPPPVHPIPDSCSGSAPYPMALTSDRQGRD